MICSEMELVLMSMANLIQGRVGSMPEEVRDILSATKPARRSGRMGMCCVLCCVGCLVKATGTERDVTLPWSL